MINKLNQKKGFVILMATLLASLFLVIGAAIFSISLKELILSSGGRESQFAFYAADTGVECAEYWDRVENIFATSTSSTSEPNNVYCVDQDVTERDDWLWNDPSVAGDFSSRTIFSFEMFPDDDSRSDCTVVSVSKSSGSTIIESRGYNSCDVDNTRRVERGLRVTY